MNKTATHHTAPATTAILERHLTRVKTKGNCKTVGDKIGSGVKWTCAFHHIASNTVWLSQVSSPVRVMDKMRLHEEHPNHTTQRFSQGLQKVLDAYPTQRKIHVYFGPRDVLVTTPLLKELEGEHAIAQGKRKTPSDRQQVWLIMHKSSGHYVLKRFTQKGLSPERVLAVHMRSFKADSPYNRVLGQRSVVFAKAHGINEQCVDQFEAEYLHAFRKPSEAARFINEYVQLRGTALALNMDAVKAARHRTVKTKEVEVMEVAAAYSPIHNPSGWRKALAEENLH